MQKINLILVGLIVMFMMSRNDDDSANPTENTETPTASELLLRSIEADGGTPFDADNPALSFTNAQNVFLPSILGIDFRVDRDVVPAGPTARFPMYQGWETTPNGEVRESYYVIMKRNLVASGDSADGILRGFPPQEVSSGAVAGAEWSSYVVLPGTDIVINAQIVANSSGIHDRIPHPDGNSPAQEDDLNNPNLSIARASVVMQLLDGWHDDKPYYFHIVTDTSDPAPAAIELGVFAPKLANLPTFGEFPGGSMLPFSPTANGRTFDNGDGYGVQGLNAASLSDRQVQDPTNTFPIDPSDERYSPMWDAHITEFTVPEADRPILRSFDQINDLLAQGILIPFRGNGNPSPLANSLSDRLTATGAIINCPVITQPEASVIGTQLGEPRN